PSVDDTIEIEVREEDIEMDVYRASGAGGKHVKKTDSAVRLRHLPSGIVVACQGERSQHKNRSTAMKMLKAKLYELEVNKRNAAARVLEDQKTDVVWATRSVRTCSTSRASRICGLGTRPGTRRQCSTARSTRSWKRASSKACKLRG